MDISNKHKFKIVHVPVTITLEDNELKRIDDLCKKTNQDRETFIHHAVVNTLFVKEDSLLLSREKNGIR